MTARTQKGSSPVRSGNEPFLFGLFRALRRRRNTLHMNGVVRHDLIAPEEPLPRLGVVVVLGRQHLRANLYGIAVRERVARLGGNGEVAHATVVEQRIAERDVAARRTGFVQTYVFAVFAGGNGRCGGCCGCSCGGGLRGGGCCGCSNNFNRFRKASSNTVFSIYSAYHLSKWCVRIGLINNSVFNPEFVKTICYHFSSNVICTPTTLFCLL